MLVPLVAAAAWLAAAQTTPVKWAWPGDMLLHEDRRGDSEGAYGAPSLAGTLADTPLERLLAPMPAQEFLTQYFEHRAVAFAMREVDVTRLFQMERDFDGLVTAALALQRAGQAGAADADRTSVRVVRRVLGDDGQYWSAAVPDAAITDAAFVREGLGRGFSVVINSAQNVHAPLEAVVGRLREMFGFRVAANMYVTPAGAQAFEEHFDWMESLVLQVEGRKDWSIYQEVVPLPRAYEHFKPDARALIPEPEQLTLETGDLLYFPRGTAHQAKTNENELSVHITLGIEVDAFTWETFLHHAIAIEAARSPEAAAQKVVDDDHPHPEAFRCPMQIADAAHLGVAATKDTFPVLRRMVPLVLAGRPELEVFFETHIMPLVAEGLDLETALVQGTQTATRDPEFGKWIPRARGPQLLHDHCLGPLLTVGMGASRFEAFLSDLFAHLSVTEVLRAMAQ